MDEFWDAVAKAIGADYQRALSDFRKRFANDPAAEQCLTNSTPEEIAQTIREQYSESS